ncbi:MAG: proton-conducting transporter membrane subunit [Pseudomonadota bacterium]
MKELTYILILLPFLAALCCFLAISSRVRSFIVLATGCILIASSLLLISHVPFAFTPQTVLGLDVHGLIQVPDFMLMFAILYFGFKHRSLLVIIPAALQIVLVTWFEVFMIEGHPATQSFYCDNLSLIMVLIISIIGSIICFQAIPYMKNHEEHLHLSTTRQPRFFFVMLFFLGVMNGLVLSNDATVIHFFFEATTLCSFLLIGHDGNEKAIRNSVRALWMNSLGCLAFIVALMMIYHSLGSIDMQQIIRTPPGAGLSFLPLALLCLASFTKSAQFPMQSWLVGAMVAPTPVSALLHSSTMVKIGVYLVLRLAPAMQGSFLSHCIAIFGAFTFLAGAGLAVGQSNGKKVLAYSTISNLGLIFACAGLNTPESITAAILLIIFHAIIKALLFLCVGTIEQHIESRDIEDMRGLYARMPLTALITVMGVVMMIMPPFGLLLGKWMAMEAAAGNIFVIILAAIGSALTAMYWARWAGTLMSDPFAGKFTLEKQPVVTWAALLSLCAGAGILSIAVPWLYAGLFTPSMTLNYVPPYTLKEGILENSYGVFAVLPLCLIAILGFLQSILAVRGATKARIWPPYLSGIQTAEPRVFMGPMNQLVKAEAGNYYLSNIFGEKKLTIWINLAAGVLLTLIVGGAL